MGKLLGGCVYWPNAGLAVLRFARNDSGSDVRDEPEGTTYLIRAIPDQFEILSANELGGLTNAPPAISDGQIFIRTAGNLYRISDGMARSVRIVAHFDNPF